MIRALFLSLLLIAGAACKKTDDEQAREALSKTLRSTIDVWIKKMHNPLTEYDAKDYRTRCAQTPVPECQEIAPYLPAQPDK